jgi:hypothetical protein
LVMCFISGIHVNQQILVMASIKGLKAGIIPSVVLPIILSLGSLRTRTPGGGANEPSRRYRWVRREMIVLSEHIGVRFTYCIA